MENLQVLPLPTNVWCSLPTSLLFYVCLSIQK